MVTFYLYDDTPSQAVYVKRLEKAVEKYQTEAKIITFTYKNAMLKHIKKAPHQADYIFITADGRNFDCLEVVKKAKELGSQAVVVIYGNGRYKKALMESQVYYLQSPFSEEEFEQVFLKACSEYEDRRQTSLEVIIKKVPERVPISEIRYLSVENRVVYAHTKDVVYRFYSTLMELEEELKKEGFIRVHRGYLVNRKYIREYRAGFVTMEDGTVIPVGRNYREGVPKELIIVGRRGRIK